MVVHTVLAYPEKQLKLTLISSVDNNALYYPPMVFYPLSFPSPIPKYATSIIKNLSF